MPIIAALPAALAIGVAASSVAAVGLTVASGFAIAAAVGATLAAVGHYANIKELKIAGTILGVIGGVGGLAASAGMFATTAAEGASLASGAAGGSGMTGVTPLATTTAAPTAAATEAIPVAASFGNADIAAGANLYSSTADIAGQMTQAGLPLETTLYESVDIIHVLNGGVPTDVPLSPPPAENLAAAPVQQGQYVDYTAPGPSEGITPSLTAEFQPNSLIDAQTPATEALPDTFGNRIGQGDNMLGGDLGGGGVRNPYDPRTGVDVPTGEVPTKEVQLAGEAPSGKPGDFGPQPKTPTPDATQQTGGTTQTTGGTTQTTGGTTQTTGSGVTIEKVGSKPIEEGIFDRLLRFAEKNSSLTIGALLSASSFISGAMKGGSSSEEAAYYAAAAERNLAAAEIDRMKVSNSFGPFPKMRNPIRPLTDEEVTRPIRRQTPTTPTTPVAVTGRTDDINQAVTGRVTL